MARTSHLRPMVLFHKSNRRRHSQKRGHVPRPLPLVVVHKAGQAGPALSLANGPFVFPTPAHHQRFQQWLHLAAGVEEGGPLGGHHPLMAVASIKISAQRLQVQWNLPRRVSAIYNSDDPRPPRPVDQISDGEDDSGG